MKYVYVYMSRMQSRCIQKQIQKVLMNALFKIDLIYIFNIYFYLIYIVSILCVCVCVVFLDIYIYIYSRRRTRWTWVVETLSNNNPCPSSPSTTILRSAYMALNTLQQDWLL